MLTYRTARWFVLAPAVLFASVSLLSAARLNGRPRRTCEVASEWVQQHKRALPTSLAEISKYPMPIRKAIYGSLPAEARRQLWREKLSLIASSSVGLNSEQRAFIRYVTRTLDQHITDPRDEGQRAVTRDQLRERAAALFDRSAEIRIFETIGNDVEASIPVPGLKGAGDACDCNMFDNDCDVNWQCDPPPGNDSCPNRDISCGWSGEQLCDGVCDPPLSRGAAKITDHKTM